MFKILLKRRLFQPRRGRI